MSNCSPGGSGSSKEADPGKSQASTPSRPRGASAKEGPTDPGFHENMAKGMQRYKEKKAEIAALKTLIKNKRHACANAYSLAWPKKRVEIAALCDKLHSLEQELEILGNGIGPVKESFDNAERFWHMEKRRQEEKYKASKQSNQGAIPASPKEPWLPLCYTHWYSNCFTYRYPPGTPSGTPGLLREIRAAESPCTLRPQKMVFSSEVSQAAPQSGGTAAAAENVGVQSHPAVLAAWAQKPNANVAAAENSGNVPSVRNAEQSVKKNPETEVLCHTAANNSAEKQDVPNVARELSQQPDASAIHTTSHLEQDRAGSDNHVKKNSQRKGGSDRSEKKEDVSTVNEGASGSGQSFANVVRGRESGGVNGVRQRNVRMTGVFKDYSISFMRVQELDEFWSKFREFSDSGMWEGFRAVPVSRPGVTILLENESIPPADLKVWLKRYGDVIGKLEKVFGYRGIWTGSWQAKVRLRTVGNAPQHIRSSAYIGRDLVCCFYPGQPMECWKCGSTRHFSISCDVLKCAMCLGVGHVAKHCPKSIRCNLCGVLGHAYGSCPMAWQSIDEEFRMEVVEPEAPLGQVFAMTHLVPDPDPIIPHNLSQPPKTPPPPKTPQPSETPQPPTSFRPMRGRGRGRGQPKGQEGGGLIPLSANRFAPLSWRERVEHKEQEFAEEEQRVSRELASSCNADSSSGFEKIDPAEAEKLPFGISAKRECFDDDRKAKRRAEIS
ncbi:hypothetical protein XELAEV_18016782mg [Xenopus laevis]|uniref:CCHC-type domain-containing protein n=1 Tax=Xenopus laevis TaxID=8355 RepID=A0A974HRT4_XENLA|nr:hypothetical protein XELAEV_18016782mg [Xenopus laevis]